MVSFRRLLPGNKHGRDSRRRIKRQKTCHDSSCYEIEDEHYNSDPSSNRINGGLMFRQMTQLRLSSSGPEDRIYRAQCLSNSARIMSRRGQVNSSRTQTDYIDTPCGNTSFESQKQNSYHETINSSTSLRASTPKSASERAPLDIIHSRIPCAYVTPKSADDMEKIAEKMVENVFTEKGHLIWNHHISMLPSPMEWKIHFARADITIYRRRVNPKVDSARRQFMYMGHIRGVTLEDIEYVLHCSTTPEHRALSSFLFRDHYLDAAVLNVMDSGLKSSTMHSDISLFEHNELRFLGIKWIACTSRLEKMVSNRDFAFFEYLKMYRDQYGDKILVRVLHSVGENVVPSKRTDFDLVRGYISCIAMYKIDKTTKSVQVFVEGCIDPCSQVSSWLGNAYLSYITPMFTEFEMCADVKYITMNQLVAKNQRWVPDRERRLCTVCTKGFAFIKRHRHHCRICGEVMCSSCIITLPYCVKREPSPDMHVQNTEASWSMSSLLSTQQRQSSMYSVPRSEKFCTKCINLIREQRQVDMQTERAQCPSFTSPSQEVSNLNMNSLTFHPPSSQAAPSEYGVEDSGPCVIKYYPDFASTRGTIMAESDLDCESSRSITESQLLRLQEEVGRSSVTTYRFGDLYPSKPTTTSAFMEPNSLDDLYISGVCFRPESNFDHRSTMFSTSPAHSGILQHSQVGTIDFKAPPIVPDESQPIELPPERNSPCAAPQRRHILLRTISLSKEAQHYPTKPKANVDRKRSISHRFGDYRNFFNR